MTGVCFGVVTFPYPLSTCFRRAVRNLQFALDAINEPDSGATVASGAADVVSISGEGNLAALFGIEGLHNLGEDVENLKVLHRRGVRYMGLAHFTSNPYAYTNMDRKGSGRGLSGLGREAIELANELGVLVDGAHTHPESLREACTISEYPVIISHTGCAALRPTPRNASDEDIVAVAETGGVIGVIYATTWLSTSIIFVHLERVVNHIDHIRKVAGIDHVALGSDWDGFIMTPRGMRDARDLPALVQLLLDRGYSRDDIEKVLGRNFLRVLSSLD